jgi:hypothetical protein
VVGAADALQHARLAPWGADLEDEIDIAPVDAEIERGGADDRPQRPSTMALSTLRRCSTASEP